MRIAKGAFMGTVTVWYLYMAVVAPVPTGIGAVFIHAITECKLSLAEARKQSLAKTAPEVV